MICSVLSSLHRFGNGSEDENWHVHRTEKALSEVKLRLDNNDEKLSKIRKEKEKMCFKEGFFKRLLSNAFCTKRFRLSFQAHDNLTQLI